MAIAMKHLPLLALVACGLALPSPARAQADVARVTLSATGGMTLGDQHGGTIGGEATIRLMRMIDVVIGGTRLADITPDDLVAGATTVAAATGATANVHQRASIFEAGVRLRLPNGSFAQPYVLLRGGTVRVTTETVFQRSGADVAPGTIGIQLGRDLDHQATKSLLTLGAGVDLSATRRVAVDAGVRYTKMFANTADVPNDIDRGVLRLQFGVGIRF